MGVSKGKQLATQRTMPIEAFPIMPTKVLEAILKHWEARPREKRGQGP